MINVIIIDDDRNDIEDLCKLLFDFPEINIIAECYSGLEGLDAIKRHKPDLIFLDIVMPGMSGFEMLNAVKTRDFFVIFTTAHDKYAINAIKMLDMSFLIKPICASDLRESLFRFKDENEKGDKLRQYEELLKNQKVGGNEKKMAITKLGGNRDFIFISKIVYCSSAGEDDAQGAYTILHLQDGDSFTATKTLKHFEDMLSPYGFFRPHKQYLVNRNYCKAYFKSNGAEISLECYPNKRIPVSRRRQTIVETLLSLK